MKANELRIGNFVLDSTKNTHKIERVDERWDYIDTYPIPLNEEWMLNFGANLFPWGWVLNGILIRTNHNDKFWVELGNGKKIDLPYVHTLQNFFALTGEELTTKE